MLEETEILGRKGMNRNPRRNRNPRKKQKP
jgi:hypothetical protein